MKISEVSQLLGLSTETIRFYEQQNIVNPLRKMNNTYRNYEVWDIFDLMECIRYRNMNFSMKEIELMMKKEDLNFLCLKVTAKHDEITKNVQKYQFILNVIEDLKEKLETAYLNIGNYWVKKNLELKYSTTRNRFVPMNANFSF
ncbi:hypothetical protein QW71_03770 [Paenibacillus sp. IHB B 3415]|uniref:MerR family transcriptional regulator n=1 Tax=Paenibacillus sp. IHB B 3415 TaxID=867080 RepID=UPI000575D5F0|nr:MerR family transcriptional regulator [Paenibacillus sp. IHB B 3415]KHL97038.1 hypothetical protein QW71_03770 [Paenibacillus sp. IHB B 3415]